MKILVENGCYELRNMGDVAMLQVAVERLRNLWPDALIQVITSAPELLTKYCPQAHPIGAEGRHIWLQDRNILGDFYQLMPEKMAGYFLRSGRWVRYHWPYFAHRLIKLKADLRGVSIEQMSDFLEALFGADLVVVSGGGDINDSFADYAETVLGLLQMSTRHSIPTVMLGQGIGPIENSQLRARAKEILCCVDLIAVREKRSTLSVLESLGVEKERIVITGDDAIEMAYKRHRARLGKGLGVNFRVAAYSQTTAEDMKTVRSALRDCSVRHEAELVPVPISFYEHESDVKSIQQILNNYEDTSDENWGIDDPVKVMEQVSRCRVVVTGSYHSAVFALSQGIPAVCLVKTAYYRDKFLGLADQFGRGCEVLFLDDKDMGAKLVTAIENAWIWAEQLRGHLLAAAERQIALGKMAYNRVYELVESHRTKTRYKVRQVQHV